jgi:predicted nucleic acid-binding protein
MGRSRRGTDIALALRLKYEFCAPELIIPEIANILWKTFQRGELSGEEVRSASALLTKSGIKYVSMKALLAKATELAIKLGHPAYDCFYLAMAIEAALPLVTADGRLIQKLRRQQFNDVVCHDLSAAVPL